MTSRSALLVVVLLLIVAGGAGAWLLFLRGDDVATLALPSIRPSPAATAAGADGSGGPSSAGPSLASASAVAVNPASLPGTWTIAADSVVGYRVRERLASLSADSDAVGRTDRITGTATISAADTALSVNAADFSVDMTAITSDRSMRDNRLRTDGLQTDAFPTSTFKLTQPVAVVAEATTGAQVDVTLHGDLTLHGVTKTVDIPAKAQLNGGLVQIAGSLSFPFSDFAIDPPNVGGFVTVEDHGTLEFLINLGQT
ncbi:MAG: hypothetical protein QOF49_941 [Chloroflexota bacterium]|jgi:polyisoprenoid-binding protein YceI|nr:hypothetical protein [Chloroflexota bacterium]